MKKRKMKMMKSSGGGHSKFMVFLIIPLVPWTSAELNL